MKHILHALLCALTALTFALTASAQTEQTKVTLKSGVELIGTVKSIDPTTAIIMTIGGVDTSISMSDVLKVEKLTSTTTAGTTDTPAASLSKEKIVRIAGVDVKFVLVEGGTFTYGYDGPGSRRAESEPVHEVTISPFYVTEWPVKHQLVEAVMGEYLAKDYRLVTDRHDFTDYAIDEKTRDIAFFNLVPKGQTYFNAPDLYNRRQNMKYTSLLPVSTAFLQRARRIIGDNGLNIMTETQWALITLLYHGIVHIPFSPEITLSVSMDVPQDPVGEIPMMKGYDHFLPRVGALHNRLSMSRYSIDESGRKIILGKLGYAIGPMHLVLPAK